MLFPLLIYQIVISNILDGPPCTTAELTWFDSKLSEAALAANDAWLPIIEAYSLDPWKGVTHDQIIDIPKKYGCYEFCSTLVAKCDKYWIKISSVDIVGLSTAKLLIPRLKRCNTFSDGETCPCGSPGPIKEGFQGTVPLAAKVKLTLKVDLKTNGGGLNAECENWWIKGTHNIWGGGVTCEMKDAQAILDLAPCGGQCKAGDDVAIRCLKALDLTIDRNDFTCTLNGDGSKIPYINDILNLVAPEIEKKVLAILAPLAVKRLNDGEMDKVLGFLMVPRECRVPESEQVDVILIE